MTSDNLLEMLGGIDETYITEYSKCSQIRTQKIPKYLKRCAVAASIALVIGVIAVPFIKESLPHNNQGYYEKIEIFPSYAKFISMLPQENLLKNVTIAAGADYKYIGQYENVDSDFFSGFSISTQAYISPYESINTTISCEIAPKTSAEERADLHDLTSTIIDDTTVYYKYNTDSERYEAVFMNGSQLYTVEYSVNDETAFFEIIKDILK